MVVIRRERLQTRGASQAWGRSHRTDEGSPFRVLPRPRPRLDPIPGAPAVSLDRGGRPRLALDRDPDGPAEAGHLAAERHDDLRLGRAPPEEAAAAVLESGLGRPGDGSEDGAEVAAAGAQHGTRSRVAASRRSVGRRAPAFPDPSVGAPSRAATPRGVSGQERASPQGPASEQARHLAGGPSLPISWPTASGSFRDDAQRADLPGRLRPGDRDQSARTSRRRLGLPFMVDRLLSPVALRDGGLGRPPRNLRPATESGSFHSD